MADLPPEDGDPIAWVLSLPYGERRAAALLPHVLGVAAALDPKGVEYARLKARLSGAGATSKDWDTAVRSLRRRSELAPEDAWHEELKRGPDGILASPKNAGLILRRWRPFETLRLNALSLEAELDGERLSEASVFRWRERIEDTFGVVLPRDLLQEAIAAVAEEHQYHPVRDYLDGLRWDGHHRIPQVPQAILDATGDPLTIRMVRCCLVSAVARVYHPGEQVDSVLSLFSPGQGKKKTTFFRVLAGDQWYGAGHIDPKDKDTYLKAHQQWFMLLDEVDELTKKLEWPAMKRWIIEREDVFRAPYARLPARHKRGFVFGATTNEQEFLHDPSGSRRFHIVRVGDRDPDARMALLAEWRDQLWAEAKEIYMGGTLSGTAPPERYLWWLTPAEEAQREGRAEVHQDRSVIDDKIDGWLARKLPGAVVRMVDVLTDALDVPHDRVASSKGLERQAGHVLRRLGWEISEVTVNGRRARIWRRRPGSDA